MLATLMLPPTVLATPMLTTDSTMARGRLRPSPRLRLTIPTPMDLDTAMDTPMLATPMLPMDTSMARGRLRLSPRLTAMATEPTDTDMPVPTPTVATAVDTSGDKSSDHATT